jgi:predicted permease
MLRLSHLRLARPLLDHEARGISPMPQALRRLVRPFRRRPGVALVVIATLGLGIGATTTVFSVVNGVLLRPLPYPEAERLVAVFTHETKRGARRNPSSPADFFEWRAASQSLEGWTGAHPWAPVLTGRGQPEPIPALKATPELFDLLRQEAALGTVFRAADPEGDRDVVVLGHRLWSQRFGADPGIVGQSLTLDGKPHTVIGVAPAGFEFPPFWATGAQMWAPLRLGAEAAANHSRFLRLFARLKPGAAFDQARVELETVTRRLAKEPPRSKSGMDVTVERLHEPVVSRVRPALFVLFGAVALVLLIACANVASVLLAHGLSREREIALRAALGAGRARLVGQLLLESVSLAAVGGLLGLWLAVLGTDALKALAPADLPRLDEVTVDARVLGFGFGLSMLVGALAGLLPALRASRSDVAAALKQGERTVGSGRHRAHDLLVVSELAVALVLLVGAGLLTRTALGLLQRTPGFATEGVLTMAVSFAGSPHYKEDRQAPFFDEVLRRVREVPGVAEAGLVNHVPIAGDNWGSSFAVEGQAHPADDVPSATFRVASPGYPKALGIPIVRGRDFGPEDRAGSGAVVLVNQSLAERYWPGQDPVGQRIRQGGAASTLPWATVIGVLGDTRQEGLLEPIRPEIVYPYTQNPVAWFANTSLVLQVRSASGPIVEAVKAAVWAVDPNLPVTQIRGMDAVLREHVAPQRFNAMVLGGFALGALVLAGVGIYGATSYAVSLRTQEIGVRMALGANRGEVFGMVIRRSALLGVLGAALGVAGALALSRLLTSLVHGVGPNDPATLAAATATLLLTSLGACAAPALRASRVDPLEALRQD